MKTLQIKIQLCNFEPSIYRTILIESDDIFYNLHMYIMNLFWFDGFHLWNFRYWKAPYDIEIWMKDDDWEQFSYEFYDADEKKLKDVFIKDC